MICRRTANKCYICGKYIMLGSEYESVKIKGYKLGKQSVPSKTLYVHTRCYNELYHPKEGK